MKRLRVIYVIEDLTKEFGDKLRFKRDIDFFPLKPGKYRHSKHELFSFNILSYETPNLTLGYKDKRFTIQDGQYTYFTLKKSDEKEIEIFFEIVEEKTLDEVKEEEKRK